MSLTSSGVVHPAIEPEYAADDSGLIGFAFKDILQNWLAGLLILLRQPFEIKDQIEVNTEPQQRGVSKQADT